MMELALVAIATAQRPITKEQESNGVVIFARPEPARTVKGLNQFLEEMRSNEGVATTYQNAPPASADEELFVSPITRSVPVTLTAVVGDWIKPLPVDDENIIDFDE